MQQVTRILFFLCLSLIFMTCEEETSMIMPSSLDTAKSLSNNKVAEVYLGKDINESMKIYSSNDKDFLIEIHDSTGHKVDSFELDYFENSVGGYFINLDHPLEAATISLDGEEGVITNPPSALSPFLSCVKKNLCNNFCINCPNWPAGTYGDNWVTPCATHGHVAALGQSIRRCALGIGSIHLSRRCTGC